MLRTENHLKDFDETIDPSGVGADWADDTYHDFH
jgi:hypothetical protein